MKATWIALLSACLTMPIAFGQGGQNQNQQQKRFGDGTGLPAYLAHYDVNKDGVIDEEERQVMDQARDQIRKQLRTDWDTDGDGKLCDKEREQARGRLRDMITECRVTRFWEAESDEDEDEELSYDEFVLLPGMAKKLSMEGGEDVVKAIFDRLDSDDNLTISLDEFLAAVKQCDRDRVSG
jgi:Ca2+-binding EF-hand superfamily protein